MEKTKICEHCMGKGEIEILPIELLQYKARAIGMYDEDRQVELEIINKINEIINYVGLLAASKVIDQLS